jgi:hypothetical protein
LTRLRVAYLGRYKLGQTVILQLQITDPTTGSPVLPDEAPHADLFDINSTLIVRLKLAITDKFRTTGFFTRMVFLGAIYPVSAYRVVYHWTIASVPEQANDAFEVTTGGNPDGQIIAMHGFTRPDANYVVQELGSGRLVKGRNPAL